MSIIVLIIKVTILLGVLLILLKNMTNLIRHINKLNNLYRSFKKDYQSLQKMFKNHSDILQEIKLSEQLLQKAFIRIAEKTEETEQKREFNKIIKGVKNEKI